MSIPKVRHNRQILDLTLDMFQILHAVHTAPKLHSWLVDADFVPKRRREQLYKTLVYLNELSSWLFYVVITFVRLTRTVFDSRLFLDVDNSACLARLWVFELHLRRFVLQLSKFELDIAFAKKHISDPLRNSSNKWLLQRLCPIDTAAGWGFVNRYWRLHINQ
jgi:hypothetical protein